jgi:hypothetical protein
MSRLYFEDVVDVNVPHPYVFVYMVDDRDTCSPSALAPFMDIGVANDHSLLMTVFESAKPVSLTIEQWNEITRVAQEYHKETLQNDD